MMKQQRVQLFSETRRGRNRIVDQIEEIGHNYDNIKRFSMRISMRILDE